MSITTPADLIQTPGDGWVIRFDSAIEFGRYYITDEGYLRVRGVATRVGTMRYEASEGGERVEMVDETTLAASADGLRHKPLTYEHPPGMLTSRTVRQYTVGEVFDSVFNAETGENEVEVEVRDADAVGAVLARKVTGLSPGYYLRREPAKDSDEYDYVQRDRRYNHLALTKNPRAGSATSLRLDSHGNTIFEPESRMDEEQLKEMQDQIATLTAGMTRVLDRLDIDDRRDSAPEPKPDPPAPEPVDDFAARYAAHRDAVAAAAKLDVEIDESASTDSIRAAVARAYLGDAFDASGDEAYIRAAYDLARASKTEPEPEPAADSNELDGLSEAFDFNANTRATALDADDRDDGLKIVDPTKLERSRGRK